MFNNILRANKIASTIPPTLCSHENRVLLIMTSLIILTWSPIINAQDSNSLLSLDELRTLAVQIKTIENTLTNIKVESEAWLERKTSRSDPSESWQRIPIYVSSTAWFDGHPGGKARVDIHKEVLEWKNGPAPYSESSYSIGFDGQSGRSVIHTTGHGGETFPLQKARLFPGRPTNLIDGWHARCTGIRFSLNFHFAGRQHTFYDIFKNAADPNYADKVPFDFTREYFQGTNCIKVAAKRPKGGEESWWLDPSKGLALIGYKWAGIYDDGTERLIRLINVTALKEVAPGIWWPVQASMISPTIGSKQSWDRFVYRASNVVANDPNFDESIFTVPIPEGYSLDEAEYKTIRTGGAAEQEKK